MIHSQEYNVEVKKVNIDIVAERGREYAPDGKICVGMKVQVKDSIDTKDVPESHADGAIKPYGLNTDEAYDVEVKEPVADTVIQEHIDAHIENSDGI